MQERAVTVDRVISSQARLDTIEVWCRVIGEVMPIRLILTREAAEGIQKELRYV